MEKTELIYGTRAVMEAVRAGRPLERIFLQAGLHNDLIKELVQMLKDHGVSFSWVPPEKLNRLTGKNHQGVVAYLSAVPFASLQQVVDHAYSQGRTPLLLLLDRVTDVRNFGAVARTAECAGVDAVVVEEKGSAPVTSDAVKTSAGALHHLPVCKVKSLRNAVKELRDNGILVVACTEKASDVMYQADLGGPVALIVGSEEDGISPELLRAADRLVKVPMKGQIQSLNVSVAAALAVYEVVRQRGYK